MSYDLNGTSQYFTGIVSSINVAEGTIIGWFAPDFNPDTTTVRKFWDKEIWRCYLHKTSSANTIAAYVDGRLATSTVTGKWTSGSWNHFAVSYKKSSDTISIYINGILIDNTKTGTWGSTSTTLTIFVGSSYAAGSFFDGRICDFAVYNKMLTASDIMRLAKGERPGSVSLENLTGYWPLAKDTASAISGTTSLTAVGAPTITANPIELKTDLSAFQIMQKCYDPAAKALRIV